MTNERTIDNIEEFGRFLLDTEDLDPLYVALNGACLEHNHLRRFLFAYWCCYHAGTACYLSEFDGSAYWDMMTAMASNAAPNPLAERWPRGHERRHFRGQKAIDSVAYCAKRFPDPERLLAWLEDETLRGRSFAALRRRVLELPQFGPWIAFKVADMLERVMGVPIDFAHADVMMFEQPYKSALMVYEQQRESGKVEGYALSDDSRVKSVASYLTTEFSTRMAPPDRHRAVNIQEVETILCKFKSHLSGSYPLGLDSRELRHGLQHWAPISWTAKRLLESAPEKSIG